MSLDMVELYMKELLMQQKLQREYLLQQQQTFNPTPSLPIVPSPTFPLFHPFQQHIALAVPPTSSTGASSSSPFAASPFPLQFATVPGTAGPFAAAPFCAAKPMVFSAPKTALMPPVSAQHDQQQKRFVCHETTFDNFVSNGADFPPLTPLVHQMFSNSSNNNNHSSTTAPFTAYNSSTFPLIDSSIITQSPSCCGSSLASLDSFPSPASSDSPDSNSSSSLCAAATVPTGSAMLLAHQQQQQQTTAKKPLYHQQHRQQQQHHNQHQPQNVPLPTNGIGTQKQQQHHQRQQQQQRPMPTDFSELMAVANNARQQQQQHHQLSQQQPRQIQLVSKKQHQQIVNNKTIVAGAQKRMASVDAEQQQTSTVSASFRKIRRTTVFVPIGTAKSLLGSASSTPTSSTTTMSSSHFGYTATTAPASSSSTAQKTMPSLSRSSITTKVTMTETTGTTSAIVSLLLAPPKAQLLGTCRRPSAMEKKPKVNHATSPSNEADRENVPAPKLSRSLALISDGMPNIVDQWHTNQMPMAMEDENLALKRESVCAEESAVSDENNTIGDDQPPVLLHAEHKRESVCAEESAAASDQKDGDDQPPQLLKAESDNWAADSRDAAVPSCSLAAQKQNAMRHASRSPLKERKRTMPDTGIEAACCVTGTQQHQLTVLTPTTTASPRADRCGPIACRWTRCTKRFADDNQLYDHLAVDHVEQLGKQVLLNEEADGTTAQAERFRCRWRKCEMHARRGDMQKKLDWLLNHLVIRHAPKAHPYKCLFANCTLRFRKLQAFKDHLRSAHDDIVPKPNARRSCGDATKVSWFELRPRVHVQNVHDCMDARTVEWLRHRLHVTLGGLDGDTDAGGTTDIYADEEMLPNSAAAPAEEPQREQQQQNNPKKVDKIGRMPLNETIAYLRNLFGPLAHGGRKRQMPPGTTSISVPAA